MAYAVTRFSNGIVLESPERFLKKVLEGRGHCRRLSPASGELQTDGRRLVTPSPGPPRLKKTPERSTLSPKGERAIKKGERAALPQEPKGLAYQNPRSIQRANQP